MFLTYFQWTELLQNLYFCLLPSLCDLRMLVSIAVFPVCRIPLYSSSLLLVDIWVCSIFFPSCTWCCSSWQMFLQGTARSWGLHLFILLDTQNCFLQWFYHFHSYQQYKRILMLHIRGQKTFSVKSHVVNILGISTKWQN